MPQRAIILTLATFGLLAVLGLILLRLNPERAAQTGPRWKRRLFALGLILFVLLGFGGCKKPTPQSKWQQIDQIWKDAGEIASGARGDYPFNERGKKRVLTQLEQARQNVKDLADEGAVSDPERALLVLNLYEFEWAVNEKRSTEMKHATCYEAPMIILAAQTSLKSLALRLPLLQQMAKSGKVSPAVLEKTLGAIEANLAVLANDAELAKLPPPERAQAEATRDDVKKALAEIKQLAN
jgi:hypothetical protein